MYRYRYLDITEDNPFMNMAIDEAIAMACKKGLVPPTIRLYTWNSPALSIGRFQDVEREIEVERCNRWGIDIVRRVTGGKAVYHKDELTYSLVSIRNGHIFSKDRVASQGIIAMALISGLKRLGIDADIIGPDNKGRKREDVPYCFLSTSQYEILFNGKKLIGSAQKRWIDIFLQQGSLPIDFDPQEALSLIRFPSEKMREEKYREAEERVTSIRKILNRDIELKEIKDALRMGFEDVFGVKLEEGTLTPYEEVLCSMLVKER